MDATHVIINTYSIIIFGSFFICTPELSKWMKKISCLSLFFSEIMVSYVACLNNWFKIYKTFSNHIHIKAEHVTPF